MLTAHVQWTPKITDLRQSQLDSVVIGKSWLGRGFLTYHRTPAGARTKYVWEVLCPNLFARSRGGDKTSSHVTTHTISTHHMVTPLWRDLDLHDPALAMNDQIMNSMWGPGITAYSSTEAS